MQRTAWFALWTALGVLVPCSKADAIIYDTKAGWTADTEGVVEIKVCIVAGSTVEQEGDDLGSKLSSASAPSFDEALGKVKAALGSSWERFGGVRFVGWQWCERLLVSDRKDYVGLYIHPDAKNQSLTGKIAALGKTSKEDHAISFLPWGSNTNTDQCISIDGYRFDCIEQYAVHEFGHLLGFVHEWHHNKTPKACIDTFSESSDEPPNPLSNYSEFGEFDDHSIMTYDGDGCANVVGERFGTTRLSPTDIIGLQKVYSPTNPMFRGRISAKAKGKTCGLQWDADAGTPSTLGDSEHVAKFDCKGKGDPLYFQPASDGYKVFAWIEGRMCTLQWDADAGEPSAIDDQEHVAKFDCDPTAIPSPLKQTNNRFFVSNRGKRCGLQWDNDLGTPSTLDKQERLAKFDCSGASDPMNLVVEHTNQISELEQTRQRILLDSNPGFCLHNWHGKAENGNRVDLYRCAKKYDKSQQWTVEADGRIKLKDAPQFCLHNWNGKAKNGNRVDLYRCAKKYDKSQQWIVDPKGPIRLKANKKFCLHDWYGKAENGNRVDLYGCSTKNGRDQTWRYEK